MLLGLLGLVGCRGESLGPDQAEPPYLAVLARIEAGSLPDPGLAFEYRIIDVSEGGTLDTVVAMLPSDTLILSVRPATYEIKLANLPPKCVSRYGSTEFVQVPEGINTAIVRFFITCNAPLAVTVYTAGGPDALSFVWELTGPSGFHQTGLIDVREDVVIFNPLAPGDYVFSLWNLPSNCEPVTAGRRRQRVTVEPDGGAILQFAVTCSQSENRPVITTFTWSYHDSAAVFLAGVSDPDRNLLGYYFDLTDCNGVSLLPGGEVERGGLNAGRTVLASPVTVIGGFELAALKLAEAEMAGACATLRVVDQFGNTTPAVERPQSPGSGAAPVATHYNAFLIGTSALTTRLEVADQDGDFFGVFAAAVLRDGVLRDPDGETDIGIYNTQGYDNTQVPDLPLGGRITSSDVYAQILYLVDARGQFRRIVDRDPFR